ncbi:MAG TPA: hypothetical protein DD727_05640 [Clostridiales bacterium]|nr:hypothetical protein [Clostridiales bacterium]
MKNKTIYSLRAVLMILVLVVGLLSLSLGLGAYIRDRAGSLSRDVEGISILLETNELGQAGNQAEEVTEKWEKTRNTFHMMLDHNELDRIDNAIQRLQLCIKTGQIARAYEEAGLIRSQMEQLMRKDSFRLANIL